MNPPKFKLGMRDAYFEALYPYFQKNRDAILVTADNGAPSLDAFSENLPEQFITVGIAEAVMIGMAAGMAFEGKKVFAYAISPFITGRVFEQVKLDICAMELPVVLVGVGAGYAYDIMGPSHHTVEDLALMRSLPNLEIYSPCDRTTAEGLADISYRTERPCYIRMDRGGLPEVYSQAPRDGFTAGVESLRQGTDLWIVATGVMVHTALKVSEMLERDGLSVGVLDAYRIKPFATERFLEGIGRCSRIVTLEEHLLAGGLGSLIAETLADVGEHRDLLRLGQRDRFVFDYGGREVIWKKYQLNAAGVVAQIQSWLEFPSLKPLSQGKLRADSVPDRL